MKAYLGITGTLFALLAVWHAFELVGHIQRGETGSWIIATIIGVMVVAGGLATWGLRLLRALPRG
ncbi:MAG: hypothetical protein ACREL4_02085 [Gemmatimonadales bacterium]